MEGEERLRGIAERVGERKADAAIADVKTESARDGVGGLGWMGFLIHRASLSFPLPNQAAGRCGGRDHRKMQEMEGRW